MSRADQSLSGVTPNTCSAKADGRHPVAPCASGAPTTKPSSASMSRRRLGPKVGCVLVGEPCAGPRAAARRCPRPRPCPRDRGSRPAGAASWAVSASPSGRKILPDVGGVLQRAVEVDVVGHLERQVHRDLGQRHGRLRPATAAVSSSRTSRQTDGPSAMNGFRLAARRAPVTTGQPRARRRRASPQTVRRPAAGRRRRRRPVRQVVEPETRRSQQAQLDEVLVGLEHAARAERGEPAAGAGSLVRVGRQPLRRAPRRRSRRAPAPPPRDHRRRARCASRAGR